MPATVLAELMVRSKYFASSRHDLCLEHRSLNRTGSVGSNRPLHKKDGAERWSTHRSSHPTRWTADFSQPEGPDAFWPELRLSSRTYLSGMPFDDNRNSDQKSFRQNGYDLANDALGSAPTGRINT
jgi:hypothetical protein